MRRLSFLVVILSLTHLPQAWGQVVPPPVLNPLNQSVVPEPPQLQQFVKSKAEAVELGKAFYWDMQTGSDGIQACASCHFHAGADNRMKNTLNPGTRGGDTTFQVAGPGEALTLADFPFHRRAAPDDTQSSPIVSNYNDVVGSQGVRLSQFVDVVPGSAADNVIPLADPVFNVGGVNTRRVTARQAPTVINSVFNFVNFWDGRANHIFNGENPFGKADPNAGVWFNDPVQGLVKRPIEIQFASLASQATGPPLDDTEMSARGRTFPLLGRKMLSLTPLGKQLVHPRDSVLGRYSQATIGQNGAIAGLTGLNASYVEMIKDAFRDNLWNSAAFTPDGFTQMEANFSLFWGLAIQLYEATLISDQTPFDDWLAGNEDALTEEQKRGFSIFSGIGNCTICHGGVELSNATADVAAFISDVDNNLFELMFVADGRQVVYDSGFNNTSVTPTTDDSARGNRSPFINPLTGDPYPLSFSELGELQAQDLLPFSTPILPLFIPSDFPVNVMGSFKVPDLRNVELTAPFFHNGGIADLDEVVDFYTRGGNFPRENIHDLDPDIITGIPAASGDEGLHNSLVAFLKSLTDERVRNESAQFDHPEILIPSGDDGTNPESFIRIPAKDHEGDVAPPTVLVINAPASPTRSDSQTISGTVEVGLVPEVIVDPPTTSGPVIISGAEWSAQITGLAEGPNTIDVRVVDQQNIETTISTNITLDTTSPDLVLNPVISPTSATYQTISGTTETGAKIMVSVSGAAPAVAYTYGTLWSYLATLSASQPNEISITASDAVGNATSLSTTILVEAGAQLPAPTACGNGILESEERCEDGNAVAGDGCDGNCHIEFNNQDKGNASEPQGPATGNPSGTDNSTDNSNEPAVGSCSLIVRAK